MLWLRYWSDLREAQVQDVGVQFVQSSGEAVPVQVVPTELAVEQRGGSDGGGADIPTALRGEALTCCKASWVN